VTAGFLYGFTEEIMVDKEKIEAAVRLYLEGIGEDVNREGLLETPNRIARMCEEIYGGMDEEPGIHLSKQFAVDNNEMVLEKDITFYSMCEHHLLPFYGKAHIAYVPDGKVVGLSKLARTVEVFARRAQIQERLTSEIADAMEEHLHPLGVMVMVEAEHTCMTMRGVKKPGSKTVSVVTRGRFASDMQLQNLFFSMVR
jgi:GTP cyclohydrolase I